MWGITTTVSEDLMQRAPVFVFSSARQARSFSQWVAEHLAEIQQEAGATSSRYARLQQIDTYLSNTFAFLRFNFRTGDAAGQNMVTKAAYEGWGKAKKLAEIIAGVVSAGEISLAAAISSADWVYSHEAMGRNK